MARIVLSYASVTPTSRYSQHQPRGFTLAEVMAVVAIVGILATIATFSVRRYILSSKTAEAMNMIGSIKAAEEAWRDETFTYLDVSRGDINAVFPQGEVANVGARKYRWANSESGFDRWQLLNVSTAQDVYYGYSCVAGSADAALPALGTATDPFNGLTPTEPWYVVRAVGDLDGDRERSFFVSASFFGEIYAENSDE